MEQELAYLSSRTIILTIKQKCNATIPLTLPTLIIMFFLSEQISNHGLQIKGLQRTESVKVYKGSK